MVSLDPVSEIKSRLQIQDVVSNYVQLKPSGRSLKGLCPFHHEKTPSFHVSPERQIAYCFGCNKGGDVFSFFQEVEGVDFKEALRLLADRAGVSLQDALPPEAFKARRDHKQNLFAVHEEVAHFYHDQLLSTPEGAPVLRYLEERGLNSITIQAFQLGFAPDSFDATSAHLFAKQYSKRDLLELGLLMSKDTTGERSFDRFRGRLMFPIHDLQGKLVGFGGRALKPEDTPKYMNSSESPLYHKSEILYGLNRAKQAIREADLAIVVEGYMDVIASHQAGICNVVASSGTALTLEQFKLLARFTSNIALSFDTDEAGEQALARAVEIGQTLDLKLRVIRVPEGKDPDECVRQNPESWKSAIDQAPFYLDYYLGHIQKNHDLSTSQGKQEACAFYFPFLMHLNSIDRDHYIHELSFLFKTDSRFVYETFQAFKKDRSRKHSISHSVPAAVASPHYSPFEYFWGLFLAFPSDFSSFCSEVFLLSEDFFEDRLKTIYKHLSSQYNANACVDIDRFLAELEGEDRAYAERLMLFVEMKTTDLSQDELKTEMKKMISNLLQLNRAKKGEHLLQEIRVAQRSQDKQLEQQLFQQYSQIVQPSS